MKYIGIFENQYGCEDVCLFIANSEHDVEREMEEMLIEYIKDYEYLVSNDYYDNAEEFYSSVEYEEYRASCMFEIYPLNEETESLVPYPITDDVFYDLT